jgi:transcriptional regulator with XRE-family HTH domain
MTVSLEDVMQKLAPEQRLQVEARAAELIEEELTLGDLRQAQHLTQERMADLMGVEHENVSRLERRAELLLSTLSSYLAAMGGKLRLVAEFPNRHPVAIALADITGAAPLKPRRRGRGQGGPLTRKNIHRATEADNHRLNCSSCGTSSSGPT